MEQSDKLRKLQPIIVRVPPRQHTVVFLDITTTRTLYTYFFVIKQYLNNKNYLKKEGKKNNQTNKHIPICKFLPSFGRKERNSRRKNWQTNKDLGLKDEKKKRSIFRHTKQKTMWRKRRMRKKIYNFCLFNRRKSEERKRWKESSVCVFFVFLDI